MADTGNIEAPESSSSTPATVRNFKNFGLSDSKLVHFYNKNKRYLEGFSRYLEIFWWYSGDFLRISGKIFRWFCVIFVERLFHTSPKVAILRPALPKSICIYMYVWSFAGLWAKQCGFEHVLNKLFISKFNVCQWLTLWWTSIPSRGE